MKNNMHIRLDTKDYDNFGDMLADIRTKGISEYFLVVNDEEVQITQTMAFGVTAFFDEYNKEVCKIV